MPYREKTAWLSLIAMAVTFGPYFTLAAIFQPEAVPNFPQLGLFAATTMVQLAILGAGHVYLAMRAPRDRRMPPDERDQAIQRRSLQSAYYVLMAGMIVVGCIMPFTDRGWTIVNAALFMIIIAEVVQQGLVVLGYRRQA
ncbi:MAG TPA: hypothetical protein VGE07_31725 [Herpetosiphonaceae bacterium]